MAKNNRVLLLSLHNMEWLDIVDDHDVVIGSAPAKEVYDAKNAHRIVHIIVKNTQEEIALQLRSRTESFCPLHWCTSAGGHVQSGETYLDAAKRELKEELGIIALPTPLFHDYYESESGQRKFLTTFTVTHNGPFEPDPTEVESTDFFSLATIWDMVQKGEKFVPELLFLLEEHFQ